MGKSRGQRRGYHGANYKLYPAETILGWRVIRHVSGAQGEEMVARGAWREVYDEQNNHIGYQIIASYKSDFEILSGPTSNSITKREIELNAGLYGRSRTAGLPEERRLSRRTREGKPLPPEDAVERTIEKVKQWPRPASRIDDGTGAAVFGDKAVRVYPQAPRK